VPIALGRRSRAGAIVIDVADAVAEEDLPGDGEASRRPVPPPTSAPPPGPVTRVRTIDALRALLMETGELVARVDFPGSSPTVPSPGPTVAPPESRPTAAPASGRPELALVDAGPAVVPAAPKPAPAPSRPGPAAVPAAPRTAPAPTGTRSSPAPIAPRPAVAPAAAKPAPPASAVARPVAAEDRVRSIHAAFAEAARTATVAVKVPSPEAIRKSLEKETERLQQRHPGQRVDFRVDVKDGKPLIKSFVLPPEK
jgi:hypothetical protein